MSGAAPEGTPTPAYVIAALVRPDLDDRLNGLIGDYKACGIGVVAVVITQTLDEENPGRAVYNGETYCTLGMSIEAVDYAARCAKNTHGEYAAEGRTLVGDGLEARQ